VCVRKSLPLLTVFSNANEIPQNDTTKRTSRTTQQPLSRVQCCNFNQVCIVKILSNAEEIHRGRRQELLSIQAQVIHLPFLDASSHPQ
jgi:hypothetical protein